MRREADFAVVAVVGHNKECTFFLFGVFDVHTLSHSRLELLSCSQLFCHHVYPASPTSAATQIFPCQDKCLSADVSKYFASDSKTSSCAISGRCKFFSALIDSRHESSCRSMQRTERHLLFACVVYCSSSRLVQSARHGEKMVRRAEPIAGAEGKLLLFCCRESGPHCTHRLYQTVTPAPAYLFNLELLSNPRSGDLISRSFCL